MDGSPERHDELTEKPAKEKARAKRRNWKRIVANLLIIGGVLALLYPLGTWGYTWIAQGSLAHQLAARHPSIEGEVASYFRASEMIPVTAIDMSVTPEHDANREAQLREERVSQQAAFKSAADVFADSLSGDAGEAIGRVVIEKIGVNVVLLEGTGTQDLREGPGHWPETPFPGQGGNFVVSGHRTTYGAPFLHLDQLQPGDEIQVLLPYVAAVYRVYRTVIVLPTETQAVAQRGVEEISLATCHPVYSAAQRLVVQAELAEYRLLDGAGASTGPLAFLFSAR